MSFFELPPKTLVIIGVLISLVIIDDLNYQQQNSLGNFLQLIGQSLEASSAQSGLQNSSYDDRLKELEKKYEVLSKYVNQDK